MHLLNFLSWSISLYFLLTTNLLIPHTVLPVSFLSVRNPPHFEHLYVAVSEMEHNDTLNVGEVKLW